MAGDGAEPASECRRLTKVGEPLERDEKHVLHHIVHVGSRRSRKHNAVHHSSKSLIELGKGGTIAALGAPDEAGNLVFRRLRRTPHRGLHVRTIVVDGC